TRRRRRPRGCRPTTRAGSLLEFWRIRLREGYHDEAVAGAPHLAGTFHSSTVVSIPPEASSLPSAENASALTRPCAPFSSPAAFPVATSHRRTDPPAPEVASSLPSGENASASRPTPNAPAGTSIRRNSLPVATSHRRTGGTLAGTFSTTGTGVAS